jgi:hypothetical protein
MDYYRNSGDDCQTTAIVGVVACAVERVPLARRDEARLRGLGRRRGKTPRLAKAKPACAGWGAVGVNPSARWDEARLRGLNWQAASAAVALIAGSFRATACRRAKPLG